MNRNIFVLFALTFTFLACSGSSKQKSGLKNEVQTKDKENLSENVEFKNSNQITFKSIDGQAVLIGKTIKLMDNELNVISDITNLNSKFVDVIGVSDSIFNETKDICDAFWYVKIKVGDKVGLVNGRNVYKIEDSSQDTSLLLNENRFEVLTTKCMAMGVDYNGDLMACPVDQPVIIRDEKNNYFGLVKVVQNEFFKKAISDTDFKYFQLRNDDGFWDDIISITDLGTSIKLKIHRGFQEGENSYDVILKYDQNNYTAEYINYGDIKYE